jgi:uncharacterized membrane protein
MKSLIQAAVVAAALAAPVAVFAQSNQPVTRAQVRAELVQLEKTGYHPGVGDNSTKRRNRCRRGREWFVGDGTPSRIKGRLEPDVRPLRY